MASRISIEDSKDEDIEGIQVIHHLPSLPIEIVVLIFDSLSLEDLFQSEKVCKTWRDASLASFSWQKHMKTIKQVNSEIRGTMLNKNG
jgi:hypothetical protein